MLTRYLNVDQSRLTRFCRRWRITELSVFGSVLRDDFRPDSDIDVLVSFERHAGWSLFDLLTMQEELTSMLGRRVDLVEEAALRNPYRRSTILRTKQTIYTRADCVDRAVAAARARVAVRRLAAD